VRLAAGLDRERGVAVELEADELALLAFLGRPGDDHDVDAVDRDHEALHADVVVLDLHAALGHRTRRWDRIGIGGIEIVAIVGLAAFDAEHLVTVIVRSTGRKQRYQNPSDGLFHHHGRCKIRAAANPALRRIPGAANQGSDTPARGATSWRGRNVRKDAIL
jgi:hypothetical protein